MAVVHGVRVDNADPEENCQTWVEKVLKRLSQMQYLSHETYQKAVDDMVAVIDEAEDEEAMS